ncbi:phage holin family protein [Flavobacterium sp.]|uniref:phage holin family protein n=1 Tax=Flavobacterium sp. TaxID=239 RepID=UPI003D0EA769
MKLLQKLLISTVIVLALSYFLTGVEVDKITTAVIVAIVLGLLNTFLKPILVFFTLPITVVTLGIFLLVINAGMVLLCDVLVDGFDIASFGTAFIFSILMSVSQWVLNQFIKD